MIYRMDDDSSPAWHDVLRRPDSVPGPDLGWVPCPAQDAPAPLGAPVWSLRLSERNVTGPGVLARYGVTGGFLTAAEALTIGPATADDVCQGGCGHEIARGQPCGALMSTRYCLCCITVTEPEGTFRTASGTVLARRDAA